MGRRAPAHDLTLILNLKRSSVADLNSLIPHAGIKLSLIPWGLREILAKYRICILPRGLESPLRPTVNSGSAINFVWNGENQEEEINLVSKVQPLKQWKIELTDANGNHFTWKVLNEQRPDSPSRNKTYPAQWREQYERQRYPRRIKIISSGGSKGCEGPPLSPFFSFSCSFGQILCQIIG